MLGGLYSVWRERTLDMAGARNRFVLAVVGVKLINVLADKIRFNPVPSYEGE